MILRLSSGAEHNEKVDCDSDVKDVHTTTASPAPTSVDWHAGYAILVGLR